MAKSLLFRCVPMLFIGWTLGVCVFACGPNKDPIPAKESKAEFFLSENWEVPSGATCFVSDGFAIDFVYSHEEMFNFDIFGYMQQCSPHRLYYAKESSEISYAETISHFAGKEGISARLIIALMELKSHFISDPRPRVAKPFGDLSHELGFIEQTRDVTARLTALRYPDVRSTRSRSPQTVLESLLSSDEMTRLADVYQTLFPGVVSPKKVYRTEEGRAVVDPNLQFPYPIGNDRWSFNGTHAPGMASIDFSRWESWGDVIVDPTVASGSGTVKVNSSCSITIVHDDGWSTSYYHMDKLMFETGDTVNVNEPIGYYADNKAQALCNGGSSTGPHVHWTLRKNGSPLSLLDVVISGWTFHPGRYDYDSDCQYMYAIRDGQKWCAYRRLLNEGAGCNENSTRPTLCGVGACSGCEGEETCKDGKWVVTTPCDPLCHATNEACNDIDDDCDGTADEDLDKPTTCGVGACASCTGIIPCEGGPDTCDPFCSASIEVCNNAIDDDCDGSTDESACETELQNLILPQNGGVLETFTSEYGDGWLAADLTNEVTNEDGWASTENPTSPQEFVYSFSEGKNVFLAEAVIYSGTAEGLYYSKDVEVWTSLNGSDYKLVASGTLANNQNDSITLYLKNTEAKKVKLTITSGYSSEYWELGEFVVKGAAHGAQDNTLPVAKEQSISTAINTAKAITLTANDADGDSLIFSVVTNPIHGTLSGTAPNLTYKPGENYTGSDSFTFKANDGKADSNIATVSITVNSEANTAPVAQDLNVTITKGTPKTITLIADDVDSDSLTYRVAENPAHGALSGTAPNLTYTPDANYIGNDSFTFKVHDGLVDSNLALVSITVVSDPGFNDISALLGCRQSSGSQTLFVPFVLCLLGLLARRRGSKPELGNAQS